MNTRVLSLFLAIFFVQQQVAFAGIGFRQSVAASGRLFCNGKFHLKNNCVKA
jgi:hypothetical protein